MPLRNPRIRVCVAACLLAGTTVCAPLVAQQQTPAQHSPALFDYNEAPSHADERAVRARQAGSQVLLSWERIPGASRYELKISTTADLSRLIHAAGTSHREYMTPSLPPGTYFYGIDGFDQDRPVGRQGLKRFIVGRPMTLSSSKERLPPPQIIGPNDMQMFPARGRVRLAWEPVPGARGYRFRLWDESKAKENARRKQQTPPRWITEVPQPWIEVRDAPYSSLMYLESGTYRWDVAAVDKDGGRVGDPAMGYFQTSRQYHLRHPTIDFRFSYSFMPSAHYKSFSANLEARPSRNSGFSGETELYFARQWGVGLSGAHSILSGIAGRPSHQSYYSLNLDLIHRSHLSVEPRGWTMHWLLGLGAHEFPNVDSPSIVGPRIGFRFNRRWSGPWEAQLLGQIMLHTWWLKEPSGSSSRLEPALHGETQVRALYNVTEDFAPGLGAGAHYRKIRYTPNTGNGESGASISGLSLQAVVQLRY